MYTSHKQELIKGVYTDIFRRGIRVLNSQNRRNFDIFVNLFWPPFTFGGWQEAHLSAHSDLVRTGFGHYYARLVNIFILFLKARRAVMGPTKCGPIWGG